MAVYLKNGMAEFDAGLDDMRKELKEAAQAFFLQRRSALRDAAFALNRISTQGTQAVRLRLEQLRGALPAWGGASDPPPGRPHGGAAGAIATIGSFCLFGREFPTR